MAGVVSVGQKYCTDDSLLELKDEEALYSWPVGRVKTAANGVWLPTRVNEKATPEPFTEAFSAPGRIDQSKALVERSELVGSGDETTAPMIT